MKLDLPLADDFDAGVWFSTAASSRYPTHWHDELELNLVLWGHAQYEIEGRTIELGPDSLLLVAPGQQHTLLGVSPDLAMWVASFRDDAVHDAAQLSGVRFGDQRAWSARQLPSARVLELSGLHARLARCEDARQVRSRSRQLLARALHAWHEQGATGEDGSFQGVGASELRSGRPLHGAVARARALLRQQEGAPSLSVLSRRCGLDAGRLSRLFKQQMGLSIVQFRNHFRVQDFIVHFGQGERVTMLDAALRSGFGSYAQFHRAFHQVTGYAPSEHLRRVRAGIVVPVQQGLHAPAVGQ
jgi:AraC-like DNA-binding protein